MLEVKEIEKNKYQFLLKTKSGAVLMDSIVFDTKQTLINTLKLLPKIIQSDLNYERKTNPDGKFLFHLKNDNAQIIGSSNLYSSEAGMENGIKNLKKIQLKDSFERI